MERSLFRIFVYGTLRPGGHYYRRFCAGRTVRETECRALGELYHLRPGYPGMKAGNDPVRGCLLEFDDPLLRRQLDRLEGFDPDRDPEQNEYQIGPVRLWDLSGTELQNAEAYWMTAEKIRRLGGIRIPTGDWIAWMKRRNGESLT